METSDHGFLALAGLKFVNVLAGAVTSFVALRFFEGLNVFEKWTTFLGGWALAAWGAPPAALYFKLDPAIEVGLALIFGLFGMAIAAALIKLLKDNVIANIISRRLGGGQ